MPSKVWVTRGRCSPVSHIWEQVIDQSRRGPVIVGISETLKLLNQGATVSLQTRASAPRESRLLTMGGPELDLQLAFFLVVNTSPLVLGATLKCNPSASTLRFCLAACDIRQGLHLQASVLHLQDRLREPVPNAGQQDDSP